MKKILLRFFLGLLMVTTASCQDSKTVKVLITEENGAPIEGVTTIVTFLGVNADHTTRKKGRTNANGIFKCNGIAQLRMSVRVEKDGYYSTRSGRLSRKKDHDVTYVLRKKKNPIALYARKKGFTLPSLGEFYGFDFEVGDWVKPHGKGNKVMCSFKMLTTVNSSNDHEQSLSVKFPQKGDGILKITAEKRNIGSDFKWLYQAPLNGYKAEELFTQVRKPKIGVKVDLGATSYALRVNTVLDENGHVLSANYVRVSKGANFYGVLSDKPGFKWTYYFNPTPNDRNLEFDPKKNLFQNLKQEELVNQP